jgi:hypothetical protein
MNFKCHPFLSGGDFHIMCTVAHFYSGNKANLDIAMVSFFVNKNKCPLVSFDRFSWHFNHGCQIVQTVCYCHVCTPSPRELHHNCVLLYILTMAVRLFKPCVIAMFVYLRPECSIITISCCIF